MKESLKKILIIEDDAALSELLKEVLEARQYRCLVLPYTKEILRVTENFQLDVILLDYLLPIMNGEELCARVKQNESTRNIPVIIYSAFSERLLPVEDFMCDVFIAKPFDLYSLLNQLEKLVLCYKHHKTGVFRR
jgi:DNA-binding response OmpR family regulator